ncbi:MAG: hypothetical protein DF168_00909 [Candidatus Moanabacter tarae]|uniref:YicC family protein n=1 Tax=Candidatus Moanibacter tarae TaxID=2200854 RepID=A0A2Z4AE59_9BACT|nr:MAG: hypothetical protein DF168_00909 [Candidatus Moanabacter tarae]|tara:strand:+ start:8337 stop:9200 length:864 start_codon:yes stop_codon:yes gene_type:complete
MTGYGRGEACEQGLGLIVELVSLNRRNFDISFSMPKEWLSLERSLSEPIRKRVFRGRIQASVRMGHLEGEEQRFWSDVYMEGALKRLSEFARNHGIPFKPTVRDLVEIAALERKASSLPEPDRVMPIAQSALETALNELMEMRECEGKSLAKDLSDRTQSLMQLIGEIQKKSVNIVPQYRILLNERLKKAGLELDLDDERVLKEIALFADRSDFSEEITRLESHIQQFQDYIGSEGQVGRKLEFLTQEINRELNTIGGKANNLHVSKLIIEAKSEVERVREQVQNVE